MGADVIKVEPPGGDDFRARPAIFAAANAGKRSMALDLKTPAGREALHALVAHGDVVVENYRPGVAAKLGLDWDALRAINPRLVYCSISGFGQAGPLKDMPAIESSVQAATGLLMAQLPQGAHPRETTMLLLDLLTGYVAYAAILAALLQRQATGVGQRIDVAMIDAALMISSITIASLGLGWSAHSCAAKRQDRAAYRRPLRVPGRHPKRIGRAAHVMEHSGSRHRHVTSVLSRRARDGTQQRKVDLRRVIIQVCSIE
jgi:crotonobetainyl-CoA:carnitine CoA-transferase CaiB-like acyl-CoA transferase